MSDYITKTASLKTTTIDTRKINAKQIDTKTLNINGISIDEKLKQAAIASRGNLLVFSAINENECVIFVKDGQLLDEPIECVCEIVDKDLGFGSKKYLGFTDNNGDSVFNLGTTVNKCIAATTQGLLEEIKLKELVMGENISVFELGESDDNLEEIYGGAFYNGYYVFILYQDNAVLAEIEQQNTASTYSLRGENTSILDKLRQIVQENS